MRRYRKQLLTAVVLTLAAVILLQRSFGVRTVRPPSGPAVAKIADAQPGQNDWPWWRGTDKLNQIQAADVPIEWSSSTNVAWRTAVPGLGHSSPIVWGNRVFLTTADNSLETVSILCFDRETGDALWQTELHRGGFRSIHAKNSHASATPACDGERVYVPVAIGQAMWVSAVDLDGKIAWQRNVGTYITTDGFGASPALHKGLVIVASDNSGRGISRLAGSSCLVALDRLTGETVWCTLRPQTDSHATPIVIKVAGRLQLLLTGKRAITSYDPDTGLELWTCRWEANRPASTVTFDDWNVYASAKYPTAETVCIRADGEGDVTESRVVWRITTSAADVPSPVFHDGQLYSIGDNGVLCCLDPATGKIVWKKRLGGNMWSSPLVAGEHLYCCNEEGTTYVVKLGTRGEIVAENVFDEGMFASPVVSGDRLLLRTVGTLYCVHRHGPSILAGKPDENSLSQ